jgi:hypothetical protein
MRLFLLVWAPSQCFVHDFPFASWYPVSSKLTTFPRPSYLESNTRLTLNLM